MSPPSYISTGDSAWLGKAQKLAKLKIWKMYKHDKKKFRYAPSFMSSKYLSLKSKLVNLLADT